MFCKYTPAVLKKELRQAILFEAHTDLPKRKAIIVSHPSLYQKFRTYSDISNKLTLCDCQFSSA
jgi:hypothetical protein